MLSLKMEIKSALKNIWFLIPCIFLCLLSLIHCFSQISAYISFVNSLTEEEKNINMCFPVYTSFNYWIGNSKSTYSTIFFYSSPLLATVPFSWSYCRDLKNHRFIDIAGRNRMYFYKYLSVFISSGLITAIPLFINFIGISIFIPSVIPDSAYDINYGMFSNNYVGILFYNTPFAYILFYIVLNFIFNGILGNLGLSISTIVKSKTVSILFPSVIVIIAEKLSNKLYTIFNYEISPISFLSSKNSMYFNGFVIFIEIITLTILTILFSIIGLRGKRHEN